MIHKVLDLGRQPVANRFLDKDQYDSEYFYHLIATFNDKNYHFSIENMVKPEDMFNDSYAYFSSNSKPMVEHFRQVSEKLKEYNPKSILEIGSNDGCFIRNFDTDISVCIEPSSNVAEITSNLGYRTYVNFFDSDIIEEVLKNHGKFDLIYSANCICHIPDLDEVFYTVSKLLTDEGLFVFEDPSLLSMIQNNSYDQIYDEHPHIFSILFINEITKKYGLEIRKVERLNVHGGSNRIYVGIKGGDIEHSVYDSLNEEIKYGLNDIEQIKEFAHRIRKSKDELVNLLTNIKENGGKIFSYGATSKSTTVFNYCGIDTKLIDFISDTSAPKIGKFSPGVHIPVVDRNSININDYDYLYMGAWNFMDFIVEKESEWISNGGKIITHVPYVRVI